MGRNLSKTCYFKNITAYTATSTSNVTTTGVDTAGYDGIIGWLRLTTGTTGHTLHAEGGTVQSTSVSDTYVDLEGTEVVGSTDTDEELMIDIYKPTKRYIRFVLTKSATAEVQFINAILYGAHAQPVENTVAGTRTAEFHASPSTGTV